MAPQSVGTDKNSPLNSGKYEQNSLQFNSEFVDVNRESSSYGSAFEKNAPNYSKFEQTREQNSPVYVDRALHSGTSQSDPLSLPSHVETAKEETSICQKPSKEMCSSGNNLVAKFKQDPGLLTKFVSNPNLVAKIFQDQRLIIKIMTDPDMVTCLAADPSITQFLEEHNAIDTTSTGRDRDVKTKVQSREAPENNGSSGNSRYMPKSKGSHVENPILTDLITNRNAEECKNQNLEPSTNTDWNKNTADVTRDVLQDVQR